MIEDYFSERQKKKKLQRRNAAIILAGLGAYGILLFVCWAVFRSPMFRIESVTVEGASTVAESNIVALFQSATLRDHGMLASALGISNILAWPGELSAKDLAFIPSIASASASKNYFTRTVTLTVTERPLFGIWCFAPPSPAAGDLRGSEDCYWFDDRGTIFRRAFDTAGNSIIVVHDYAERHEGISGTILPGDFVPAMFSIINVLRASGLGIREIRIDDLSLEEVSVATYEGPTLRFSLRFPADNDLGVIKSLMANPNFGKIGYVDFRVKNRAYYK